MSTGKQLAALLLLSSALTFPQLALAQEAPPSEDGPTEDAVVDDQGGGDEPDDQDAEQPDISIPGGAIVVTGRRIRDITRSSTQVVSVLDAEAIARTGEGDIAGALTHVTGLSVVGAGRVYVRGLGDRYSLALLNGLPLPSPEPLSRVVPLDLFPTDVIASSLVQKSYSANFPGEFGGGVINLTTIAVPDESFIKISGSVSGDSRTSFEQGLSYFGSDIDWTGYDNGNRDIPSNLAAFFASGERIEDTSVETQEGIAAQIFPFNLVTLQKVNKLPANFSGSISAGTSFDIGSDATLGVVATAGLKSSWRNRSVVSQAASNDLSTLTEDFTTFITDNNVTVNGLLGLGLDWGAHTFRFTTLYIHDTLKTARLALGTKYQLGADGFDFADQNTAWFERQLFDTQFVGELDFDPLTVELRGGYAQTKRKAPFDATFSYTRTHLGPYGEEYVAYLNRQSDTGLQTVSFDDLTEDQWFGSVDASYRLLDNLTATVGYAYNTTDRYSVRREFSPRAEGDFLDDTLIPAIGLRLPGEIINGSSLAAFNIRLDETSPFPAFDAAMEINAGYGLIRYNPFDRLTVDLGVRYEDSTQTVALDQTIFNTPIAGSTETDIASSYWLPSLTLTWEATDSLQLRASASKTIARPQFRELVEQLYYDPESNRAYRGNPFLVNSVLYNGELRAEYYYDSKSKLSLAGFYKKIDNPIESFVTNESTSLVTSFANAPEAQLYGAEFEGQYSFDLADWGGFFAAKQLVTQLNYTYSKSTIKVGEGDVTRIPPSGDVPADLYFTDGDPLTGQSDHVANFQLSLEDQDVLQQFTLLVNYASKRSVSRGFQRPDIVEDPGVTVDFVARGEVKAFKHPFEVKFEVRNIFGRDHWEYQANDENRIEINSYRVGTSASLGISTEF